MLGGLPHVFQMELLPGPLTRLRDGSVSDIAALGKPVAAVAGIGHPQRFFATLRALGVPFRAYPFADHYPFSPQDLYFPEEVVVMTEKDAVKCKPFATDDMYFVPVEARIGASFWDALFSRLPNL
jgi:tetraacyldisaccharide 4'-kinase